MVMDGVDLMSKAELVILCEKHKLDGGKTVASMRYALKRFFEDNDEPDAKKLKTDPSKGPAGPPPGFCGLGESCPALHSLPHRTALKHGGEYRDVPIKCRDGMGCAKLKEKEHLKKYAHDDDLTKVCSNGADCPLLHVMAHRVQFEHPGFRAQPVLCRDGAACVNIKDKGHLYKYAHNIPVDGAATTTTSGMSSAASTATLLAAATTTTSFLSSSASSTSSTVSAPAMLAAPSLSFVAPAPAVYSSPENSAPSAPVPPLVSVPTMVVTTAPIATPSASVTGTLDDYPLEQATDAVLTPLDRNSEEFWELEERFLAHLQGRNEDYVEKRIKAGKKPLRFVLTGAEKISNPILEKRFEIRKQMMNKERESKDCRERVSFHGTHPKNLKSIIKTGLLRFKHPLNPCKVQVDDGYFGTNKKGVYVSRYADYTLKYSNRVCAVEPLDEVKTIMFRTLPGKSKHIEKLVGGIDPTPGFDSHSSPTFLEWYLFDESQCCPQYVLNVKAVEDTRTAADDE